MKSFNKIIIFFIAVSIILFTASNMLILKEASGNTNEYKVELNSVIHKLDEQEEISLDEFDNITGVYHFDDTQSLYNSNKEYVIYESNGELYRIEYRHNDFDNTNAVAVINAALGVMTIFGAAVLIYIKENIIQVRRRQIYKAHVCK